MNILKRYGYSFSAKTVPYFIVNFSEDKRYERRVKAAHLIEKGVEPDTEKYLMLLYSSAANLLSFEGYKAPGTKCGSPGAENSPPGQLTDAFLNIAGVHYAGSPGTPSLEHANSPHAISQYDIACFQVTQHGLFFPTP